MKLGHIVAQERQRKGLSATEVASRLGLTDREYEALEAGEHGTLEEIAMLLVNFNEIIEGQVNQLFYPCGLPFSEVQSYKVMA